MARNLLIQVRRDTASNWTVVNPILAVGEFGYETDTGKVKIGDGVKNWNVLGYLPDNLSDNVVTNAFLRDSQGLSVIGRSTNSPGDPADIIASQDHQVLRRAGNTLGFGQVSSGGIADAAITSEKIADGTIVDADIGDDAAINPSKIGPGPLPDDVTVTTPSYTVRSVTQSKLSNTQDSTGIGVWQTYTPVLSTEDETTPGTYDVLYAKYMKINNLMMVNVLLQFTNVAQFSNIIYCTLPQQPAAPNLTVLGSAYHLNSDARPNMPPIVPIKYEDKVAFLDHRGQYFYNWYYYYWGEYNYPYYWWWDYYRWRDRDNENDPWPYQLEEKKGFYLGTFETPDRFSFDLTYEVA